MRDEERKFLLQRLLLINVPKFIAHISNRGGVQKEEWDWLHNSEDISPDARNGVMANADKFLVYPSNIEDFKKGLFVLVKAIAIMSFVPGGIYFLGVHFSSDIDNYFEIEE